MKPSQLHKFIVKRACSKSKRPIMIWGPPGSGKSKTVEAAAEEYNNIMTLLMKKSPKGVLTPPSNGHLMDIRVSLMDQTGADFRFPLVDSKTSVVRWITSDEFPKDGWGIIFLDELVQGCQAVQAACSSLILDRKIGTYKLPPGWLVAGAGNRESDRASTNKMPSHIANRFTHIEMKIDLDDWTAIAYKLKFNPMVIAFVNLRPELLHQFDPKNKTNPTYRTWELVSEDLEDDDYPMDDCLPEIIAGEIGEAAATEFMGFIRVFREMPDYDVICKRPEGTKVPENAAARYAVAAMLTQRAKVEHMRPITKYVERMPKDFQILTMNEMTKRNPRLCETSAYIEWLAANKDAFIQ